MQFKPFEKNIEVNGRSIKSFISGFKHFKTLATKYLLAVNIGEMGKDGYVVIKDNEWYSQEAFLSAFEKMVNEMGDQNLYEIGKTVPENAQFPPWVNDIYSAIKSINIAYHLNHRKNNQVMYDSSSEKFIEGIGHYEYATNPDKKLITITCKNPYPCTFDKGLIEAMAKKYIPSINLVHDNTKSCRKTGADSCTYSITW